MCYGETYNESLGLDAFPENIALYAGGNSWLAEVLYTAIYATLAM